MKEKGGGFFWASFTDLMISLFFIMLVLYVLTFVTLKREQKATKDQLNKIKEIQAAVKELPKDYFDYQPEFKRFSLKKQIQFAKKDSKIAKEYEDDLLKVGKSIEDLITKLKTQYKNENIKYLIVIEGMASNDGYSLNDELSYQRALSLARFWKENKIIFDPNFCELQIAGSGTGGIGRFPASEESKNQQFLIQVVPKIGEIE
jgi:outer membrane protein OmpA-like peptidoglycan-associated protein